MKKKNIFLITDNTKKKYRDSKFWHIYGKDIPQEFIHFFNILMKEREINIDDLLNNNWLNSIPKSGVEKINLEDKYKNYFKERYKTLKEFEDGENLKIDGIFIAEGVAGGSNFAKKIGIMAGASTPIEEIEKVKGRLV